MRTDDVEEKKLIKIFEGGLKSTASSQFRLNFFICTANHGGSGLGQTKSEGW